MASYDVGAAGYLLKPIDIKRLAALLHRIFCGDLHRRIEIKCGKQYRYPFINQILYIEGSGHKATLCLADGSRFETLEQFSTLKELLHDDCFVQCHQSYLVNMNYIADIQKEIYMANGDTLPISARRKAQMIESYHRFFADFLA